MSYKLVSKRGLGQKGYILSVKYLDYYDYKIAINPFIFPRYKKRLKEF